MKVNRAARIGDCFAHRGQAGKAAARGIRDLQRECDVPPSHTVRLLRYHSMNTARRGGLVCKLSFRCIDQRRCWSFDRSAIPSACCAAEALPKAIASAKNPMHAQNNVGAASGLAPGGDWVFFR